MALGRDFRPDEGLPGADHVLIMANRLWRERYYADPHIIGKFVSVDQEPYQVVGVLPPSPQDRADTQFIVPVLPRNDSAGASGMQDYGIVGGRLKPGVTIEQAQAEIAVINKQLIKNRGWGGEADAISTSVEPLENDWLDHKL
jgi:hypothetical protein